MKEKYDRIGKNYNATRKADPYLTSRLLHHLAPQKGKTYLDIGCGTGNYTNAVAQDKYHFIGLDPSTEMLAKARKKNEDIVWMKGKAEQIPLADNSIDGMMASLTLHHWTSLDVGFQELNRVLKSNGKFIVFTATPQQMKGYWLNHYFPKMLADSMIQMPSFESIENNLRKHNFSIIETEKYFMRDDLEDLFLYAGKNNPSLYLDPIVRNGISSFSSLANQKEVEKGLALLQKDITSGKINEIIEHYKNEEGDYLYLIASH
jgi:ubiquinone/menaquinone biosynthesis C-methylase UbiE